MTASFPEAKDKTPKQQHTGVTHGWQSGIGATYPDTYKEPSPEKTPKDEAEPERSSHD